MICKKCGNDDKNNFVFPPREGNEFFETLNYWVSASNWDEDDFYAKYKCKQCGEIRTVSQ